MMTVKKGGPGRQFKPGNKGKPPGATNKVNRLVKDVFAQVFSDLQEDPKHSLETYARENKRDFYALVTKLIPVQLQHAGEVINRLIIEDSAKCEPLKIDTDESNPGIQGQPEGLQLP